MAVRMMVRGLLATAVTAGAAVPMVLLGAPTATADPCPKGTARVFLANSTNSCQSAGTVRYTAAPVSKVCSMASTNVTVVIETNLKKQPRREVSLHNGRCASFDFRTQIGNSVTVTPN